MTKLMPECEYALAHAEDALTVEILSQLIRAALPEATLGEVLGVMQAIFSPIDAFEIPWELLCSR